MFVYMLKDADTQKRLDNTGFGSSEFTCALQDSMIIRNYTEPSDTVTVSFLGKSKILLRADIEVDEVRMFEIDKWLPISTGIRVNNSSLSFFVSGKTPGDGGDYLLKLKNGQIVIDHYSFCDCLFEQNDWKNIAAWAPFCEVRI